MLPADRFGAGSSIAQLVFQRLKVEIRGADGRQWIIEEYYSVRLLFLRGRDRLFSYRETSW